MEKQKNTLEAPNQLLEKAGLWTGILVFAVFAAAPFLCMIITTFKTDVDLYRKDENRRQRNPFVYNLPPTTDHLELLLFETPYPVYIRNSLIIGAAVVVVTLALALPAAYALGKSVV